MTNLGDKLSGAVYHRKGLKLVLNEEPEKVWFKKPPPPMKMKISHQCGCHQPVHCQRKGATSHDLGDRSSPNGPGQAQLKQGHVHVVYRGPKGSELGGGSITVFPSNAFEGETSSTSLRGF